MYTTFVAPATYVLQLHGHVYSILYDFNILCVFYSLNWVNHKK